MSQHDLTIDNQTFPLFRTDLNLALKALSECQSGTSAPTHLANGVLWLDTTADPNILKMYNSGAPSNWMTIGEFNVASGIFTTARLDGLTATIAQLNFSVGVTSAIQTQLNARATLTTAQTLTNKTLTAPTINGVVISGEIQEETGTMPAGTTPAIDPANGTVQEWTLTANSSPTDSLVDGEFVELLIQDGTAYTITWPTITWLTDVATAPTLGLTTVTPVLIQKVGTTLYGRRTGDGG